MSCATKVRREGTNDDEKRRVKMLTIGNKRLPVTSRVIEEIEMTKTPEKGCIAMRMLLPACSSVSLERELLLETLLCFIHNNTANDSCFNAPETN